MALLIVLTAFFVVSEFAIVKVRITQINQLIEEGNRNAVYAKKLLNNLDGYLSACQLGITVTALGLGWLGEPTFARLLRPVIESLNINEAMTPVLSVGIAFFLITFLHVVVGELAPKTIAIQKAEATTLLVAKPLILFYRVMYPFIWLLNGSARLLVRLFGINPAANHDAAHTEEELRLIMSESYKRGEINKTEMTYVNNVFEFDDRLAREVMVPRTEMVVLYKDDSFDQNLEIIREGQYTRYPVAEGDKDNIIGLVNLKHFFTGQFEKEITSIEPFIRPILHISEATPIKQVLRKMQKERIHMAIVIDEYGGTAGLLTVEDILEEIVGEIRDEFDANEVPMIEKINDTTYIVDGKLFISEMNELIGTSLVDPEVDTIGGWIFTRNVNAKKGTTFEDNGFKFIVDEVDGYQIKKVKVVKL